MHYLHYRFVITLSSLCVLLPLAAQSAPPTGSTGGGMMSQGMGGSKGMQGMEGMRMENMGHMTGMSMNGDPKKGEKIAQAVCAGCHGPKGISASDDFPNLAGQNPMYIMSSLLAYQNKVRDVPMMNDVAARLSGQDIADLAAYYGSLASAE